MALLEIVVVAVLILLNGYLAMCELAIVSSRRSHLERLASGGHAGACAALILANDPARFLASLQIGITSVAVLTGTFSGATLAHRLDDWLDLFPATSPYSKPIAFALIVVSVTFLSLLFGELVPKQIALLLHEYATSLSAAGHANRSRRLIKCAKDSGHYSGPTLLIDLSWMWHLAPVQSNAQSFQTSRKIKSECSFS